MTEKMVKAINGAVDIREFLYNDLEYAVFDDYKELRDIKKAYPNAIMSGSGSTYFILENVEASCMNKDYIMINNLHFIPDGINEAC